MRVGRSVKVKRLFHTCRRHKTGMELTDTEFLGISRRSPPKPIGGIFDAPYNAAIGAKSYRAYLRRIYGQADDATIGWYDT